MELSRIILLVLKHEYGKLRLSVLLNLTMRHPAFLKLPKPPTSTFITHTIDVLVYDGYIIKEYNGAYDEYQLSAKGYERLRAWYAPKKILNLISTDVAKILSLIATALSIVATYISIKSRF